MLEEPLCDDEYEYYTDEDEADIEDEASEEVIEDNLVIFCFLRMKMTP